MSQIFPDATESAILIVNDFDEQETGEFFNCLGTMLLLEHRSLLFVNYLDANGKQFFKTIAKLILETQ